MKRVRVIGSGPAEVKIYPLKPEAERISLIPDRLV